MGIKQYYLIMLQISSEGGEATLTMETTRGIYEQEIQQLQRSCSNMHLTLISHRCLEILTLNSH